MWLECCNMRRTSMRSFLLRTSEELKDLPLVVTKRGKVFCTVLANGKNVVTKEKNVATIPEVETTSPTGEIKGYGKGVQVDKKSAANL